MTERAWHSLFIRNMFIQELDPEKLAAFAPDFTVIDAPGFNAVPEVDGTRSEVFVVLNLARKEVIIGGTDYAGEMKKSIFTVMNYLLPKRGRHAHALLGQLGRATRRVRHLLRPVRHRQDHAVGRPRAHADR